MAALDVLQVVRHTATAGASQNVTFSAVSEGDLIVFAYSLELGFNTITPPAGLTSYTERVTEWPRLATYARRVASGDSATWTFTISGDTPQVCHAFRIEGPFDDLTPLTITDNDSFNSSTTSRDVLTADVSVAADTLVIAALTKYNQNAVTFDNSFGNQLSDTSGSNMLTTTARRLYTGAASDVATNASWSSGASGNTALIRVASPAPAPTTAPKHRRRIVGHRPRAKTAPRLRSAFASILSGNSVTPATLPPDYYTPRNPTVTFPSPVSATVTFPDAVTPTVSFTP